MLNAGPDPHAGRLITQTAHDNWQRFEMRRRPRPTAGHPMPNGGPRALVDLAAECRALGCLLRQPAAAVRVDRSLFTEARHLAILDTLRETGDVVECFDRLPQHRQYLIDLIDPDQDSVLELEIRRLREARRRRQAHAMLVVGANRLAHDDADTRTVIAAVREQLAELEQP